MNIINLFFKIDSLERPEILSAKFYLMQKKLIVNWKVQHYGDSMLTKVRLLDSRSDKTLFETRRKFIYKVFFCLILSPFYFEKWI